REPARALPGRGARHHLLVADVGGRGEWAARPDLRHQGGARLAAGESQLPRPAARQRTRARVSSRQRLPRSDREAQLAVAVRTSRSVHRGVREHLSERGTHDGGAHRRSCARRVRHRLPDGAGRRARGPLHREGDREREEEGVGGRELYAAGMKRLAPLILLWAHSRVMAQDAMTTTEPARAIAAPRVPLPAEAATAGVTKFSFIAYGDTRGRHDGTQLQADDKLGIELMLATIKRAKTSADPIRFLRQGGAAV